MTSAWDVSQLLGLKYEGLYNENYFFKFGKQDIPVPCGRGLEAAKEAAGRHIMNRLGGMLAASGY